MKTKLAISILLIVSLLAAGCIGNSNKDVDIDDVNKDVTQNIKSSSSLGESTDWCKAGSEYSSKSGTEMVTSKIIGLTTFKGQEVCEMQYTTNEYAITQYISQDSKFHYQIMKDKSGNVISEGGGNAP